MNKINKIIITSLTLACSLSVSAKTTSIKNTSYGWVDCWTSIDGMALGSDAKSTAIDDIIKAVNDDFQSPVLKASTDDRDSMIEVIKKSTQLINETILESRSLVNQQKVLMRKNFTEKELEYTKHLKESSLNDELYGFFENDKKPSSEVDKGSQSYAYFKKLCKKNKMFSSISSPAHSTNKNINKNTSTTKKINEKLSPSNGSTQSAKKSLTKRLKSFCSVGDIENNLCKNKNLKLCDKNDSSKGVCSFENGEIALFEMQNADVDSTVFLTPSNEKDKSYMISDVLGDSVGTKEDIENAKSVAFKTDYTYSDLESEAAELFSHNVIFSGSVPAPSKEDELTSSKSKFVSRYKSDIAALFLANNSFGNSIEMKKPITSGETKMSELDLIRYMMFNMKDPDSKTAFDSGKKNAKSVEVFSIMTIGNKLSLMKIQQNERLEALLSVILAREVNSPKNIESLEELKR